MSAKSGQQVWLIAVPTDKSATTTQEKLKRSVVDKSLCTLSPFCIPQMKVGTLDSLMAVSDSLQVADAETEILVKKVKKTYIDMVEDDRQFQAKQGLAESESRTEPELFVFDKPASVYISNFEWDAKRFPMTMNLQAATEMIQNLSGQYSEALKHNLSKYGETKSTLSTLQRKSQGSLLLRSLDNVVDPEDVVFGEYVKTLMVVVNKAREEEWLNSYEKMEKNITMDDMIHRSGKRRHESVDKDDSVEEQEHAHAKLERLLATGIVVPGSAKRLAEDAEFALYRVVVLAVGADAYQSQCRLNKFTVRHYEYRPVEAKSAGELEERLLDERGKRWRKLMHWCTASYSEMFRAWMHLKAIRIFTEAVLRYGLPVDFQSYALTLTTDKERKLRTALGSLYSNLSGASMSSIQGGQDEVDFSGVGAEFYPYVYFGIDTTEL